MMDEQRHVRRFGRYFLLKSGVHALYCEGACPHAPATSANNFCGGAETGEGHSQGQMQLCRQIIQRDLTEGRRKAKDYVRDLLYDALRDADSSVEAFEESVSSENIYQRCGSPERPN